MKRKKSIHRDEDELSDNERRFCQAYIIDPRPRRAAIAAGYPIDRATKQGQYLLKQPKIQAVIQDARDELAAQYEVTRDRIIRELSFLAFSNIADFTRLGNGGDRVIDLSNSSREQLAAITEMTSEVYFEKSGEYTDDGEPIVDQIKKTKIKLSSKRDALVDLGKTLGLFENDKDPNNITVVITGGLPDTDIPPDAAPGSG